MYQQNPTTLLQQQLTSLSYSTWQEQLEIIDSLPQSAQIVKLINNRNYSSDLASLLASQNPRSKLVTRLTEYLMGLFGQYCNQLTSFANLLVTNDCLLRLLASGNKVVAASANQLLKCIISNTNFKEKGKIKYVKTLENQFLSSKNIFVREKISLYFLYIATSHHYGTKEELGEFEKKVVKTGLEDACEKVRKNMKQILVNLSHFEKENQISIPSLDKKPEKRQPKKSGKQIGSKVIYSSITHDSLINHHKDEDIGESNIQCSTEKIDTGQEISINNYEFYLERLENGGSWSMTIIAFETLTNLIRRNALSELDNDKLYCETIQKLIPFLSEKRAKTYQTSTTILIQLIQYILQRKKIQIIHFLEQHISQIIEQAIKVQSVGSQLLPILIKVNPSLVLFKMAELSIHVKIHKYRLVLMDNLVRGMEKVGSEYFWSKTSKKVTSIVRVMCQHISESPSREKDTALAALAVISQLKSLYPSQVLTTLLSQNDKALSKIIEVAESIDETLKDALVNFIHSRKGNQKFTHESFFNKNTKDFKDLIEKQMQMIIQNKSEKITKVGQLYLTHGNSLSCQDFSSLLGLLEYLQTQDLIMEYRFLLSELASTINYDFIAALIDKLTKHSYEEEREYHNLMFTELLALTVKNMNENSMEHQEMLEKISECLIELYRVSKSLKVRNSTIQTLSLFSQEILKEDLKQNELQLVKAYKMRLQSQSESSEDILDSHFY